VLVAAAFWIVNLTPTTIVGDNVAVAVPNIIGETYVDGGNKLLELGLAPVKVDVPDEDHPIGTILAVDPEVGTKLSPNQEVRVSVSSGPPRVALVGLTFKTEQEAKDIIAGLKLVYGETTVAYSPNVPKDTVIGIQLPPDDTLINTAQQVVKGSTVNLVVSNGLVKIPDLTGQAVTQAQATLTGSELQLSVQLTPDNGCSGQNVTSQSLVGDQPQRSTVTLVYCAA